MAGDPVIEEAPAPSDRGNVPSGHGEVTEVSPPAVRPVAPTRGPLPVEPPVLFRCGQCDAVTVDTHFYRDRATGLLQHEPDVVLRTKAAARCGWRCTYDGPEPAPMRCALGVDHDGPHDPQVRGYRPFAATSPSAIAPPAVPDGLG